MWVCVYTHTYLATTLYIMMKGNIWSMPISDYILSPMQIFIKQTKCYAIYSITWWSLSSFSFYVFQKVPPWKFSQGSCNNHSSSQVKLLSKCQMTESSTRLWARIRWKSWTPDTFLKGTGYWTHYIIFFWFIEWDCLYISIESTYLEQHSFH